VRPPALQVDRAEQEYHFIRGLIADGIYPTALEQIRLFIASWPESNRIEEVHLLQAEVHFLQEDYRRTVDLLKAFEINYPQSRYLDRALYRRGEAHFKLSDYQSASADFEAIASRRPASELIDRARYWLGESNLHLGEIEQARQAYQSVYKQTPSSSVADYAIYSMGWIAQEQEEYADGLTYYQYTEAADAMSQVLQLDLGPEVSANAGFLLGESYYHTGEYALARRHYEDVVREHPAHEVAPEAQVAIGWTYLREDRHEQAADAFQRAVTEYPASDLAGGAQYRAGVALRESGRGPGAVRAFLDAAGNYPRNEWADDALLEAGLIRYREGAYVEARSVLSRLLDDYGSGPLAPDAAELLGECHLAEGDYEAAETAFDRVLQSWPDTEAGYQALFQRSFAQYRLGKLADAAAGFLAYRQAAPDSDLGADALFFQAEALYQAGNHINSALLYETYLNRYPNGPRALAASYGIGWARFSREEYSEAIEAFRQVVAYPEGDEALKRDARLRIGDSYYNLHLFRDAAVTYREVLLRDPNAADADRVALSAGDAYIRAEQYAAALPLLGEIVTRFPASERYDDALYWRGWALFRMEEYDRAIAEYQKVLELVPPGELEPNARYSIGDAHYNAGRFEEALAAYRELAETHPSDRWLGEAVTGMQWALMQLDRTMEAEQLADSFIGPGTPPAVRRQVRLRQGRFLYDQERFADAIVVFDPLATGPGGEQADEAAFYLARSHLQLGNELRAEQAFSSLVARSSGGTFADGARVGLGELLVGRGAHSEAIRTLEPLITAQVPDRARALYVSAQAHRALGETARSEAELRRLIEDYPGSRLAAEGRILLAEVALEGRNFNIAQTQLNTVLAERVDDLAAQAQFLVGEVLFLQQDWQAAEVQYLKVKYVYPSFTTWIARALERAAEANIQLGDNEKARTQLQSILDDYPNAPNLARVRALLERIPR
jgi:TolA-binding protein